MLSSNWLASALDSPPSHSLYLCFLSKIPCKTLRAKIIQTQVQENMSSLHGSLDDRRPFRRSQQEDCADRSPVLGPRDVLGPLGSGMCCGPAFIYSTTAFTRGCCRLEWGRNRTTPMPSLASGTLHTDHGSSKPSSPAISFWDSPKAKTGTSRSMHVACWRTSSL